MLESKFFKLTDTLNTFPVSYASWYWNVLMIDQNILKKKKNSVTSVSASKVQICQVSLSLLCGSTEQKKLDVMYSANVTTLCILIPPLPHSNNIFCVLEHQSRVSVFPDWYDIVQLFVRLSTETVNMTRLSTPGFLKLEVVPPWKIYKTESQGALEANAVQNLQPIHPYD